MTEKERVETEFTFPSATKSLEDLLTGHIERLVRGMERPLDVVDGQQKIGRTFLMSLVEVVWSVEST